MEKTTYELFLELLTDDLEDMNNHINDIYNINILDIAHHNYNLVQKNKALCSENEQLVKIMWND